MHSSAQAASMLPISPAPIRLHGLDALRGIAAVLVVLLHAGIPYMTNPMSFLAWPARDLHPSPTVDGVTWCAECFLMPLFFVLAGFFSAGLLIARGENAFLVGRTKRLLSTQLAASVFILPACVYIWTLGWIADGLYSPGRYLIFGLPPALKAELFGFAHLWFLQYLYIYCMILGCASWLCRKNALKTNRPQAGDSTEPLPRWDASASAEGGCWMIRALDRSFASAWKPLVPVIPCAVILYLDTRVVLGFYQTFIPVVSKLTYYAIYFFTGVMLYRHHRQMHVHARFGKRYLAAAAAIFAFGLPLIHQHMAVPSTGWQLAFLTSLLSLFAWFTTFGLFSIFLHQRIRQNSVTGYLAEASFWVYLIHLPVVVLAQIAIAQLHIPSEVKFLASGCTALLVALMSYHVFVRNTWLGEFLNGCRRLQTEAAQPKIESTPAVKITFRSPRPFLVPALRMPSAEQAVEVEEALASTCR